MAVSLPDGRQALNNVQTFEFPGTAMPLSDRMIAVLRCPVCGGALGPVDREFVCSNSACARAYPVIGGIPLLANDATGIYQRDDFVGAGQALQAGASARSLGARVRKVTPSILGGGTFAANMRILVATLGTDEPGRPATIVCIGTAADAEVIRSLLVGHAVELVHMATRPTRWRCCAGSRHFGLSPADTP